MAKPRVYEIAKDLGLDSKTVLEKLKDMGEFVKSASSTVEPPVERKLKAALAPKGDGAAKGKGKEQPKAAAPKATPKPIAKPGPAKPGPAKPGAAKHSAVPGPKPHRNNNPQQRGDRPAAQHAQQSKPGARPAKPGPKPTPARSVRILQARAQAIIHSAVSRACILRRRVIFRVRIRWLARR